MLPEAKSVLIHILASMRKRHSTLVEGRAELQEWYPRRS